MSSLMCPGRNHPYLPVLTSIAVISVALLMLSSLCLAQTRWLPDGVEVCAEAAEQQSPRITPDGAGGAIIAWEDERGGNQDIYAQRVDSGGTPLWDADGMPVSTAAGSQCDQRLVSDGAGGTIITWEDERGGDWDIYTQRVDSAGERLWENGPGSGDYNGIPVCTAVNNQENPRITTNGEGGAIITWQDLRCG